MKILIATHNQGKFNELMEVLHVLPFEFVSLTDLGISSDVDENGATYEDNAIIKAEHFGKLANLPTIADDSGIHIDALSGKLGVHTRRWGAGVQASDKEWLDYFLKRMENESNRKAEFISVIAFYNPHEIGQVQPPLPKGEQALVNLQSGVITFRGECKGVILHQPQVDLEPGIPLSAVFLPEGKDYVFSALSKDEKNSISHRGKAIHQCVTYLNTVHE
ncbi:hypothetical protein COY07_04970 [Candidatus Peregrinibacteria bacterium CG_4_10_14_0_2_um_filter_43_11]|nr:MAG: hypothetical protein COY07_04970 [Candidatus Peregrinibacteria bacterium CG_4_10_14_0_2_um_filter_43_11]